MKACAQCETQFQPERMGQRVCSPTCARRVVAADKKQKAERAKLDRMMDKAKRESLKTLADLKAEAQKEVNLYVRLRDQGKPCISCGKAWEPTFQAGHYRSRGAAGHLALDPRNIAGQCTQCNLHRHGNAIGFRAGLVEREGREAVEQLEHDNLPVKLDRDTLRQLKTIFRAKARDLKKGNA
jgi:hypothetical protein